MPSLNRSTELTITNPLVVYRTLVAAGRLQPDPAQHRLALHLQKLYFRLKDYRPKSDFEHRFAQLRRLSKRHDARSSEDGIRPQEPIGSRRRGLWNSFQEKKAEAQELALTKRLTDYESALQIQSPQGLLLHGEVGIGKSLLIDLLADSLPNEKKRRWHFNTFMLETFARLENVRKARLMKDSFADVDRDEGSLVWVARDLISSSPILFLDEFQLPDRAASKILSNLMTSFFHLGGVLVATSNRMPEELANASGIEFSPPVSSRIEALGRRLGLSNGKHYGSRSAKMFSGKGDFATFLEVLKARCEIWDMGGEKDWRRRESGTRTSHAFSGPEAMDLDAKTFEGPEPITAGNIGLGYEQSVHISRGKEGPKLEANTVAPKFYYLKTDHSFESSWEIVEKIPIKPAQASIMVPGQEVTVWQTMTFYVYGRKLIVPRRIDRVTKWTFSELCTTNLGPADYITLASNFHTFILTDVPILTLLHKNEARRFITLLDALYEARCKLLISADAGPDDIFFPEMQSALVKTASSPDDSDGVYPETFAEIYQDASAPFRPNISAYQSSASTPDYAPTMSSPFANTRSILADEDSDFGPTYGTARGRGVSDGSPGAGHEIGRVDLPPDFTRAGAYTGEDERFAYKRARSRLWEMCSQRWWERQEDG